MSKIDKRLSSFLIFFLCICTVLGAVSPSASALFGKQKDTAPQKPYVSDYYSDKTNDIFITEDTWISYKGKPTMTTGKAMPGTNSDYMILPAPLFDCTGIGFDYQVTDLSSGSCSGTRDIMVCSIEYGWSVLNTQFDYGSKNSVASAAATWDSPCTLVAFGISPVKTDNSVYNYRIDLTDVRIQNYSPDSSASQTQANTNQGIYVNPNISGYNMVVYVTQAEADAAGHHYRQFRNYSINNNFANYGVRQSYGEKCFRLFLTVEQLSKATVYNPGDYIYDDGKLYVGGYNKTDLKAYVLPIALDSSGRYYPMFVESTVYK
ncbi:MAG: hypothetical protein Q4F31_02505 [Eubacteriales bacterium]|nr:hypothetical protein [Eubacteriales bacterium]